MNVIISSSKSDHNDNFDGNEVRKCILPDFESVMISCAIWNEYSWLLLISWYIWRCFSFWWGFMHISRRWPTYLIKIDLSMRLTLLYIPWYYNMAVLKRSEVKGMGINFKVKMLPTAEIMENNEWLFPEILKLSVIHIKSKVYRHCWAGGSISIYKAVTVRLQWRAIEIYLYLYQWNEWYSIA